jgi:hypothetical protein
MVSHHSSETGIDHGLANWLHGMNEVKLRTCALSYKTGSLGDAPTHCSQIYTGYD